MRKNPNFIVKMFCISKVLNIVGMSLVLQYGVCVERGAETALIRLEGI